MTLRTRDEYGNPVHGIAGLEGFVSKATADAGGSPGSNLNLQGLVGSLITVNLELDGKITAAAFENNGYGVDIMRAAGDVLPASLGKGVRHINGLVRKVAYAGVDGRSALYEVTLVPWV